MLALTDKEKFRSAQPHAHDWLTNVLLLFYSGDRMFQECYKQIFECFGPGQSAPFKTLIPKKSVEHVSNIVREKRNRTFLLEYLEQIWENGYPSPERLCYWQEVILPQNNIMLKIIFLALNEMEEHTTPPTH